MHCNS